PARTDARPAREQPDAAVVGDRLAGRDAQPTTRPSRSAGRPVRRRRPRGEAVRRRRRTRRRPTALAGGGRPVRQRLRRGVAAARVLRTAGIPPGTATIDHLLLLDDATADLVAASGASASYQPRLCVPPPPPRPPERRDLPAAPRPPCRRTPAPSRSLRPC